jgi:hypothetical protein
MHVQTKFLRLRKPVSLGDASMAGVSAGSVDGTNAEFSSLSWFASFVGLPEIIVTEASVGENGELSFVEFSQHLSS